MDTTWISGATSGVFNYLYNSLTGEDESAGTYRSRNTLCKGMRVTDLPTNNYEPLEVSHGARAMAKKYNRERELEEKISVLKAQCNAKSKDNVCLQDKVSELQQNGEKKANDLAKKLEEKQQLMKKAKKFVCVTKGKLLKKEGEVEELNQELLSIKDTFANLDKSNQSLSSQVAELKTLLAKREDTHKQQQQLITTLAEDAENKLEKTSANVSKLIDELTVCKAENSELRRLNGALEVQRENLQEQLKEASDDSMEIKHELDSSKERENQSQSTITSLKERLTEAQEKLNNMAEQLQQNEQYNRKKEELFQQVATLQSQLNSSNAELQDVLQTKTEMMVLLGSSKAENLELRRLNSVLEVQRENLQEQLKEASGDSMKMRNVLLSVCTEAQEKLNNMAEQLQQKETDNLKKEELFQQVATLKSQLSSSNAELQDVLQTKTEMMVLLDSSKERENKSQNTIKSLKERLTEAQEKLNNMADKLQQNEQDNRKKEEIFQQVSTLKSKLNSCNAELQDVLQAKTEMMVLLDSSQEKLKEIDNRQQEREKVIQEKEELSREISSLKSQLSSSSAALQDVFQAKSEVTALLNSSKAECNSNLRSPPFICPTKNIASPVQHDFPAPRNDPVKTQQTAEFYNNVPPPPIVCATKKIASSVQHDFPVPRNDPVQTQQTAECYNKVPPPHFVCPTKNIASSVQHDFPVPRNDPVQPQQTGGSSAIYVNTFSTREIKSDKAVNARPPPVVCPTKDIASPVQHNFPVPRQTRQTDGSSGIYVSPFSMRMRSVKSDKADCYSNLRPPPLPSARKRTKQLRPSSPFIPVSNLPAPVVTQTSQVHKNQKKNIKVNPFSGIGSQGLFNNTLKWFGF